MRTLRGRALDRLASLASSSTAPSSAAPNADFAKLCDACSAPQAANGQPETSRATGQVPMSLREFEVLLALCKAAPSIPDLFSANRLLQQISPYVSESSFQVLAPSSFLHTIKPSPWEVLSHSLVNATLGIGLRHRSLRDAAFGVIWSYVERTTHLASRLENGDGMTDLKGTSTQDILGVVTLTASLLGFLQAATTNIRFWDQREQNQLIQALQNILSNKLLVTVEATMSSIRTAQSCTGSMKDWRRYLKHYASVGRPFGALALQQGFMKVVEACAAGFLLDMPPTTDMPVTLDLMRFIQVHKQFYPTADDALLDTVVNVCSREVVKLEDGADYLQLGSAWEQRLGHSVKASALVAFFCCSLVNEEVAEQESLISWLEAALADPGQAANEELAGSALRCMALLSSTSPSVASRMTRSILQYLVKGALPAPVATIAAESLLFALRVLPQDTTITTLYSLGNSLSVSGSTETNGRFTLFNDLNMEVAAQPDTYEDEKTMTLRRTPSVNTVLPSDAYNSIIGAIVIIAKGYGDEKINALSLSMLIQKVGKVNRAVDMKIITEVAALAVDGGSVGFRSLLRLYARLHQESVARNDQLTVRAVADAHEYLSTTLRGGSELYELYLHHLLESITSKGDMTPSKEDDNNEFEWAAQELALLLRPLSLLALNNLSTDGIENVEDFPTLQRDAWYNIVLHGFTPKSLLMRRNLQELRVLARYTRPLIDEVLANKLESDVDLNTVLRRGKNSENERQHQREMIDLLPQAESVIKSLSYPELIFLQAAYLIETLRATTGNCTKVLEYFIDPQFRGSAHRGSALGSCMEAVAVKAVDVYLSSALDGTKDAFHTPEVAEQLALIFEACCHRVAEVQRVAYICAERILALIPSALCQRGSLFALLDLLTIMWASCLEAETDEYDWKSLHKAPHRSTQVQLSDDYAFRRQTLKTFHAKAKTWVAKAINIAPLDVKGLLQTYLSFLGDDEAFGHLSLGRSFAFDQGGMIPTTDQRLAAIEHDDELHINTASDFMSQYTTRQQYRFTDPLESKDLSSSMRMLNGPINGRSGLSSSIDPPSNTAAITIALAQMETRLLKKQPVPSSDIKDLLRRTASLLCRGEGDQASIAAYFVRIPFLVFSKHIVKFGLSLWLGVIKENPEMESRLLVEIVEGWITTVRGKLGIFNPHMTHVDPFFLKEEFAPSDKEGNFRQQQRAHDHIVPHFRVLQFLSSHYTATRLNNSTIESVYLRFLKVTLSGLRHTAGHPLAREVHFHIILLALKFLKQCTSLDAISRWRLKDSLLSAALAWFAHPPRWSFGGNRLQIKAETNLLSDVAALLQSVSTMGLHVPSPLRSLQGKQELLQILIADELSRLMVWLFPLDHSKRQLLGSGQHARSSAEAVSSALKVAWDEDPDIAVNLGPRFKSERLDSEIRGYLLNFPEKALHNAYALQLMLGSSLPSDISSQLKYLMYWTPVDPITAVTYFLPTYGNHPCIVQYAVRALDSHSVDITFFYVPQIVQTLRYDVLGYVERYIIETAKFSQLFAHQIIWNMKANAFKDEDSQIPDSVKPTLDKVLESLTSSFSPDDRAFYEREFSFFNKITGISGTLRPFIKRPKPEKKQKIEEELRQIQVDVGVYLPSNPDGVIVGIDRKSGKPLQSHAKAPYMATFRIRKEKSDDMENTEQQLEDANSSRQPQQKPTFEVWQSAIFKVGDDCRQDVLALQMIAAFRGIFHFVGLPVYVFPYRVTATAPGCGVIDVLPNSISRDMLGREAVNGLYDWFIASFGSEVSPTFQAARNNFVKSLAAYSVISYLLQFKDRHNGNIMFDDQGHILHIDFGFCFDIAPGGVRFERAPFKLTKEMVAVMGGGTTTQAFQWFQELCVKAFLASRPFVQQLTNLVLCMLDSGLPCFKPETIQHFRERFVLEKSEREAADFMRGLIQKSYEALSTKGYDQFQLLTNGIPY